MFENIKKNGEMITLGNETAATKDLFIHWSDYGDGFYDLVICYKDTELMFGDCAWCAIPKKNISNRAKELKKITGIDDIKKEKVDPDEWMYS